MAVASFGKESDSEARAREFAASSGGSARQDPVSGNWLVDHDGPGADPQFDSDPAGWFDGENTNEYAAEGLEDWQSDLADVPILGDLFFNGARDRAMNLREQNESKRVWDAVAASMPGEDELSVEYGNESNWDEYGDLMGPESQIAGDSTGLRAQGRALRDLQRVSDRGGYTSADRAMSAALRQQQGTALRGANAAAAQQMGARGMGGGGAELAMRLSGSEAMSQGNALADAQIQQAAMQRMMQSLGAQGSIGASQNAGQLARQQGLDRFNQQRTDWRRGREERNTTWGNRTRESAANAAQQAYGNRERWAAGRTGQYQQSQDNRRSDSQREKDDAMGAVSALGDFF